MLHLKGLRCTETWKKSCTWRSSRECKSPSSDAPPPIAGSSVAACTGGWNRKWRPRTPLERACSADRNRGCWKATRSRRGRSRRGRPPPRTPFPPGPAGPYLATLFRRIYLIADKPRANCNSVDRPARSSPPGCYGQEPILRANSLDTNAIVNSGKTLRGGNGRDPDLKSTKRE